jgi:hypothetical protein
LSEIAEQNQNESTIDKEQKKEKRRKKVTKELFETEKTYLNQISSMFIPLIQTDAINF